MSAKELLVKLVEIENALRNKKKKYQSIRNEFETANPNAYLEPIEVIKARAKQTAYYDSTEMLRNLIVELSSAA